MKTNNLIYLGLGALIAYLIFKPKGASATSTSPSPDPAPMPMPPSPSPMPPSPAPNNTSEKYVIGNTYSRMLKDDYNKDYQRGKIVTGVFVSKVFNQVGGGYSANLVRGINPTGTNVVIPEALLVSILR